MNVTIKFEEGSGSNGNSNGPRPRRKPKPELIFTRDALKPFKLRSYTCVKCCKRVEVHPGGYLQKIDSNLQNPCIHLLCSDCFQAKNYAHPICQTEDGDSSSLPLKNGGTNDNEAEVPNDMLRKLQDLSQGQSEAQGEEVAETKSEIDSMEIESNCTQSQGGKLTTIGVSVEAPLSIKIEGLLSHNPASSPKTNSSSKEAGPSKGKSDVPPGRINLTEKACEMIKQERKQRELKQTSPPGVAATAKDLSPIANLISPKQDTLEESTNASVQGDLKDFDLLRKQIETTWQNLPDTGFVRTSLSLPVTPLPSAKAKDTKPGQSLQPKKKIKIGTKAEPAAAITTSGQIIGQPEPEAPRESENLYWFKCPICSEKRFALSKSLDDHLRDCHQGSDLYPCPHCDKSFLLFSSFLSHKSVHLDMIEYLCKYCAGEFSSEIDYCKHLQKHKNPTYKCELCSKKFLMRVGLDKHMGEVHGRKEAKSTTEQRPQQDQQGPGPSSAGSSAKPQALVVKPILKCSKCEMTFDQQIALYHHFEDKHALVVTIQPSPSEGQSTQSMPGPSTSTKIRRVARRTRMRRWIPRTPIASNEFSCEICKTNCPDAQYLARHMATHSDTLFKCHICAKGYLTRPPLERHLVLVHTNEKFYPCSKCQKSFPLFSQLESHEKTHSTERPFLCQLCGKTFLNQAYVNSHVRHAHMGVKNYVLAKKKKVDGRMQGGPSSSASAEHSPVIKKRPKVKRKSITLGGNLSVETSVKETVTSAEAGAEPEPTPEVEFPVETPKITPKRTYTKRAFTTNKIPKKSNDEFDEDDDSSDNGNELSTSGDFRRSVRVRKASSRYT